MSTTEALEGALVTGTSAEGRERIYWIQGGEKVWVLNPEVFSARSWRFTDVRTIPDEDLDAIPASGQVIGQHLEYAPREHAHARVPAPFLSGTGIVLSGSGAAWGSGPELPLPEGASAEFFEGGGAVADPVGDKAIRERFPSGADFLIATHVLEHRADPIGALIEWTSYLRDGGTLVVSVPCAQFCPDRGRLVPDVEHLLFDFLFERGPDHFESREHAYSCTAGWLAVLEDWRGLEGPRASGLMHAMAHHQKLETHWHAFTPELFDELLQLASQLGPRPLHALAWANPYERDSTHATIGDIVGVLRVGGAAQPEDVGFRERGVVEKLPAVQKSLERALDKLRGG